MPGHVREWCRSMREAIAVIVGSVVMAVTVIARQAPAPAGGQSLPSGVTALAPSPPAGPPPDPAAVARGTVVYETTLNCAACHGITGRGGPNNAPDLTRSALAMQPDGGRGLAAFLRVGRPDKGMPPVVDTAERSGCGGSLREAAFAGLCCRASARGPWCAAGSRRAATARRARRTAVVDPRRRSEGRQTVLRRARLQVLVVPLGPGGRAELTRPTSRTSRPSIPTRKRFRTRC